MTFNIQLFGAAGKVTSSCHLVIYLVIGVEKTLRLHRETAGSEA